MCITASTVASSQACPQCLWQAMALHTEAGGWHLTQTQLQAGSSPANAAQKNE